MKKYLALVEKVLEEGVLLENRTKVPALTINGAMLQHDMKEGFPLLTTKKMAFKSLKVELEFFIKGYTDKKWLQERGCHIWDNWCNPEKVPPGLPLEERKTYQKNENDLGFIYGYQWRNFNGFDQLKNAVQKLKNNPNDRQIVVSAWNPNQIHQMALPPCHVLFHLTTIKKHLNLTWFQRSCDLCLGVPFNLASYSLLLHLIAKECHLKEGLVTGMLSDVHIYENQLELVKQQLLRKPLALPTIKTPSFKSIWQWEHQQTELIQYKSHEKITFPLAV